MFSKGYRPKSQEHHLAVISFMQAVYSAKFPPEVLQAFDRARRRRNESLYDKAEIITEKQATNLSRKSRHLCEKGSRDSVTRLRIEIQVSLRELRFGSIRPIIE